MKPLLFSGCFPWLAAALLAAAMPVRAPAQIQAIVINEFVADNKDGLQDEDGAASDWLELYNPTSAPVPLAGAVLTDDVSELTKWPLPEVSVPARGYLVIFASSKDRRNPAAPLHTNFALSKNGEFLALVWQGQVVSGFAPSFPAQEQDVSYGSRVDGSSDLVFMRQPTPGAPNDPASGLPEPVGIDPPGRTFSVPFNAALTAGRPDAVIHYTMDGTVPTAASPVYAGPLPITATTRLRAMARAGGSNSAVTSASWVRLAPDLAGYSSPLPLMVIENFNGGPVPAKGLNAQQVAAQSAAWLIQERRGTTADWSDVPQLYGEIGIRGRGHFSSTWSKKPYAVECRAADGSDGEASPLDLPSNDDWVLYYPDPADFRDPTMIANTFIYELSRRMGRYAPRFRFVELFLNADGGDLTLADRQGVYVLLEKISRGSQRLDFSSLSADGTTGGALLAINRPDAVPETGFPAPNGATSPQFFRTAGPDRILQTTPNVLNLTGDDLPGNSSAAINFEQPGGYRILTAQRSAIEAWFRQFEDALYHPADWRDPNVGWRKWLVEEDWAQGYLLHNFTRHFDALRLSVYPWLGDDRKLRMGPVWDVTPDSYSYGDPPEQGLFYRADQLWFARLFQDVDFKQTYLDQWARWRRAGFSDAAMQSIIDAQAAEITAAKAVSQGMPTGAEWQTRLTAMKTWVKGRAAYFDSNFVPLPVILPAGGIVAAGTAVTISSTATESWVAIDGSDPRLPGGGVAPAAVSATSLVVTQDVRLTARSRRGTEWSAPVSVVFAVGAVPATASNLSLAEIHYHPAVASAGEAADGFEDREASEFIELHNTGTQKLSLHDVSLVLDSALFEPAWSGASADQWTLPPDGRLVVVKNRAAFAKRYGMAGPVGGVFSGDLPNNGGEMMLKNDPGAALLTVSYGTNGVWPASADGAGYSLTLREGADPGTPSSWRTSVAKHGTPGTSDAVRYTGSTAADWKLYAFGDPARMELSGSGAESRLSLLIPPGADRARYAVEESMDLQTWHQPPWRGPLESRTVSGETLLSWEPSSGAPSRFLRLRATAFP